MISSIQIENTEIYLLVKTYHFKNKVISLYNIVMENHYQFAKDVDFVSETLELSLNKIISELKVSESGFYHALKGGEAPNEILESFYSFAYQNGFRLNKVKEEMFRENLKNDEILLFHGSSLGIQKIDPKGSREDCDFSYGFYCGESYSSALCFVEGDPESSVYAFKTNLDGLKVGQFHNDLEWMLSICYHRGTLKKYENHPKLLKLIQKHQDDDVIIAPIANNKMFRVMQGFAKGEISDAQAIHALSASRLGKQYVFKTSKAVSKLLELERLYLCVREKEASRTSSLERAHEIQTKLDLSKREYRREGFYIDEVFR